MNIKFKECDDILLVDEYAKFDHVALQRTRWCLFQLVQSTGEPLFVFLRGDLGFQFDGRGKR